MTVVKACRKAKLHRSTFYKLLRRVMDGELEIEPELMEIATKIYEGTLARVPSIAAKKQELDPGGFSTSYPNTWRKTLGRYSTLC